MPIHGMWSGLGAISWPLTTVETLARPSFRSMSLWIPNGRATLPSFTNDFARPGRAQDTAYGEDVSAGLAHQVMRQSCRLGSDA